MRCTCVAGSVCLVGIYFFLATLSGTWNFPYQGSNQHPRQWKHSVNCWTAREVPGERLEMAPKIHAGQVCQLPFLPAHQGSPTLAFFSFPKSYRERDCNAQDHLA